MSDFINVEAILCLKIAHVVAASSLFLSWFEWKLKLILFDANMGENVNVKILIIFMYP